MARTYTDMLNSAMTYQKAFNEAHARIAEGKHLNASAGYLARQSVLREHELIGYCSAMADMFGKTLEDIRTDVHDFTEAVEAREGR